MPRSFGVSEGKDKRHFSSFAYTKAKGSSSRDGWWSSCQHSFGLGCHFWTHPYGSSGELMRRCYNWTPGERTELLCSTALQEPDHFLRPMHTVGFSAQQLRVGTSHPASIEVSAIPLYLKIQILVIKTKTTDQISSCKDLNDLYWNFKCVQQMSSLPCERAIKLSW